MRIARKQCVFLLVSATLISAGMWAGYCYGVRKERSAAIGGPFYVNLELYMQMYKMRAYIDEVSPEKDGFIGLGGARLLLWGSVMTYDANKVDIDKYDANNSDRIRDRNVRLLEEAREIAGDVRPIPLKPLVLEAIKAAEGQSVSRGQPQK